MSIYESVLVYSDAGYFLGYTIKKRDVLKLQTTNLYSEDELPQLNEQLARLNNDVDLRKFWPHPQDPEVRNLLANQEFYPIEMAEHEVVDTDRSYLVYFEENEVDEHGNPTGNMIDGPILNEEASVIHHKKITAPANPGDNLMRIKAACEVIARQRAGAAGIRV